MVKEDYSFGKILGDSSGALAYYLGTIAVIMVLLMFIVPPALAGSTDGDTTYYYSQSGEITIPAISKANGDTWCKAHFGPSYEIGGQRVLGFNSGDWNGAPTLEINYIYGGNYDIPQQNQTIGGTHRSIETVANCLIPGTIVPGYHYRWTDLQEPANFTASPMTGDKPLDVEFTIVDNRSTSNRIWNFGDGNTSTISGSPVHHTYTSYGTYSVTMEVNDELGSAEKVALNLIEVKPGASYAFGVSPNRINVGETTHAIILAPSGTSALNAYTLIATGETGQKYAITTANGQDPTFILTGGTWKQWSNQNHSYSINQAGFPSDITLTGFTSPGGISIEATLFNIDNSPIPKMYAEVNVSGSGVMRKVHMRVRDLDTQGYVSGATASILKPDGTWLNSTVASGPVDVTIADGSYIGFTASASGYDPASVLYTQITRDDVWLDATLSKTKSYGIGTTGLRVYVRTGDSGQWVAIWQAQVSLSDGQVKTTPASGMVEFTVNQSTTYYYTVTKEPYNEVTGSVVVGTGVAGVSVEMTKKVAPTITPVPTGPDGNPITAAPTEDPYPCTVDFPENCQRKQEEAGNWVTNNLLTFMWILGIFTFLSICAMVVNQWRTTGKARKY